jgi:hypothetical protein
MVDNLASPRERRLRNHTIGRRGSLWSLKAARKEAQRLLGEVVAGGDPGAEKQTLARYGATVSEVWQRQDLEDIAKKKPSTQNTDRNRYAANIRPLIGSKDLAAITASDALAIKESQGLRRGIEARLKPISTGCLERGHLHDAVGRAPW